MRTLTAIVLLSLALAASHADAREVESRAWEFAVKLDGKPIGYHRYEFVPAENGYEILSEAQFDVRFLFINAFRYRHTNRERWDGDCLSAIQSNTRQNGERFFVSAERSGDGLNVESSVAEDTLGGCVMSFAYWDRRVLEQSRLLDPQSGEYVPVEVRPLGNEQLTVRGEAVEAAAYLLKTDRAELKVWYSANDEWLGLESTARGGRIIRYELT